MHFKLLANQLKEILKSSSSESESLEVPVYQKGIKRKQETNEDIGFPTMDKKTGLLNCPHCEKKFKQNYVLRPHLLKCHRSEVFQKYFDCGTPLDRVKFVVDQLLKQVMRELVGGRRECCYCYLTSPSLTSGQDHVILQHFNEFVTKLKNCLEPVTVTIVENRSRGLPYYPVKTEEESSSGVKMEAVERADADMSHLFLDPQDQDKDPLGNKAIAGK